MVSAVETEVSEKWISTCVSIQFNPCKPIKPKHPTSVTSPPLKDRIHCVAYVLNINSVNTLSAKMVAKLKEVHKDAGACGESHCINTENFEINTIHRKLRREW